MICIACGQEPARPGSEFGEHCARQFEQEDWYQREYIDPERDAFRIEFGEEAHGYVRRDFTHQEINKFARELRPAQRKRARDAWHESRSQ